MEIIFEAEQNNGEVLLGMDCEHDDGSSCGYACSGWND